MIKNFKEFINEYHNDGISVRNQVEYYFLPPFMWSDVKLGTTEIERASYFTIFDGVKDTRVMPDGKLRVASTPEAMMEIVFDFYDVMNNEDFLNEMTEYMGKRPETEEEIIEYLRTNE